MRWYARLFRKRLAEKQLDTELRFHLDQTIEDFVAAGMSRDEARRQARLQFGGLDQVKEECREASRARLLESLSQDVHFGVRMLARKPAFAALVILTLGLGIGANTATFSIVDAVLVRPLPYRDPDRLVVIWGAEIGHSGTSKIFDSYRDFEEWQRSSRGFEQLEALTWAFVGQTLSWQGKPRSVLAIPATQGIFSLLGVPAAQGRTFLSDDLKNGCTLVLAHGFWQDQLGSPRNLPGGSLTLDGKACTVVGVMPRGFNFYPKQTSLWTLITPESEYALHPLDSLVGVFGRLKPGVSQASAQAELTGIHQRLVSQLPAETWIAQFVPAVYALQSEFTWLAGRNLRTALLVLLAAVTLVLLIACLNVANLILGRAGEREKELAIRIALGSGRGRLIRQLLTETFLLAGLGGALGVLLATAAVRYFRTANPVELPPGNAVTVNPHVLAFTALLAILTSLLAGLVPAFKASRPQIDMVLKQAGRGVTRTALSRPTGKLLVVMEAALSLVLLAGAGLLIESMARIGSVSLGFSPDHVLTGEINLPKARYPDARRQAEFYEKLTSNLVTLPGVQGAALSSWLPLGGGPANQVLAVEGRPAPGTEVGDVAVDIVSPDFFRVTRIPLLWGREFNRRDREHSHPAAIVNEALVKEYFSHEDPLGKEIRLGTSHEIQQKAPWITIVGVVGDVKRTIVYQEMGYIVPPAVYLPVEQSPRDSIGLILRSAGDPMTLRPAVERIMWDLDQEVPVSDLRTADDRIAEFLAQPRFRTVLLSVFAGLALLLAAVGLYGVLSQSVSQRTNEIGIRMALGAQRGHVVSLVVREGVSLALAGIGVGLVAALLFTRFLTAMLYGVRPTDPLTLAIVALTMSLVALLASYFPARRATNVDPMAALRHE
jgi:putative ABC transport system permease protein